MEQSDQRSRSRRLLGYCKDIKAILHLGPHESRYLRPLGKKTMHRDGFISLDSRRFLASEVDYGALKVVADVTMLHPYHDVGVFQPTYEEVVCQIPDSLIDEVCAFEIMYAPSDDIDLDIFAEALEAGYHVYVVRLYGCKRPEEESAPVPFDYPKGASVPEGMDKDEFRKICEAKSEQWYW